MVLQFEGNRALVKADVQDKKVMISRTGPAAGRRLLAVIRSDSEHIHLNVTELLSGVDLEGTRKAVTPLDREARPVRLFFSYSHKDEALRNELDAQLKLLQRRGLIASWHDRKIEPGEKWGEEIDENLKQADTPLLLVSADFIASEYIWEKEMKPALERHKQREARVIAIILRDLNWKTASFAELQVLPKEGLAVTKWPDRDSAWRNVSEGIERVAEQIRKHRDKN